MKDPTHELIAAIITLLGSTLTYASHIFSVYDDVPNNPTNRYVWFPAATLTDEGTKDKYRCGVILNIQIVTKGSQNKASRQAITGIGTIILQALIRADITMSSHTISEHGYLEQINHSSAFEEDGGLTLIGDYIIKFVTQQK